jgi:phytoene desaturase
VFDTGPTVVTMPDILRDVFAAVGAELDAFVELIRLDPVYRATFADGSTLRVLSDPGAMTAEIRAVCGERDADQFARFRAWLRALYEVEMPHFLARNYDSPFDLVRAVRPAFALARLGGFRRLERKVNSCFADERLRRVFSFQSMYAGLAPYQALALLGVITYMDSVEGAFYPRGGVHELPCSLAAALSKAGVDISYGTPVAEILLERGDDGPVRGVRLASGATIGADAVVCNADLPLAYPALLPGLASPRRRRRIRFSPSAFVWHAGVRGTPGNEVAHHNIHFGGAWRDALHSVLDAGRRMPDPSIFVTAASTSDATLAPPGRTTLFALEPVPNLDGVVDWHVERSRARDDLARRLATLGYPTEVEVEEIYDPLDWRRLGMARGTPFSAAHTFFQSGPFRTPNTDPRAPGLVFVGSGTVPGIGIPMVLLSGRLAADRVTEHTG